MEFIDKIRSVELKPTLQLGHHPPLSPTGGGVRSNDGGGGVCLDWNRSDPGWFINLGLRWDYTSMLCINVADELLLSKYWAASAGVYEVI